MPEDSRRGRPGTGTAPGLAPRWHQARSWGGSASKPRLFGAGCGNPALPPRGARGAALWAQVAKGRSEEELEHELGGAGTRWRGKRRRPGCSTRLQLLACRQSLPRAGAQQRPLGWGPREMQPSASPQTPCPTGKERPWAPFGCPGSAWCQQAAAPGVGLRSPQAVAGFTASVGRCL